MKGESAKAREGKSKFSAKGLRIVVHSMRSLIGLPWSLVTLFRCCSLLRVLKIRLVESERMRFDVPRGPSCCVSSIVKGIATMRRLERRFVGWIFTLSTVFSSVTLSMMVL